MVQAVAKVVHEDLQPSRALDFYETTRRELAAKR